MNAKIEFTYPENIRCVLAQGDPKVKGGTKFIGEKGWIWVNRGKFESSDPALTAQVSKEALKGDVSPDHHKNWLDSIVSGKLPVCDAEIGHRSATVCHLGNIAARLKRAIKWDPAKEVCLDDKEANEMLTRSYRGPWKDPGV